MDWGNAIVRTKEKDANGKIKSIIMDLNLEGDFRKTKKKITWLSQPTNEHPLPPVTLVDFDYLITKKKLEENDDVKDFVTPVTEFKEYAYADASVLDLSKGDIIQFERKGYFIYDGEKDGAREFFKIPDGRAAGIASKAGVPASEPTTQTEKTEDTTPEISMYKVQKLVDGKEQTDIVPSMYKVDSIYK